MSSGISRRLRNTSAIQRTGGLLKRRGCAYAVTVLLLSLVPQPAHGQKTDTLVVDNGNLIIGEIKGLARGQLKFSTDAMSTLYAEWPKVSTIGTTKIFEVFLEDGAIYFGSLRTSSGDTVLIVEAGRELPVPTQSVVALQRIKPNFWDALDGNMNLGFGFTQQNAKTDLNFSGLVQYAARQGRSLIDGSMRSDGITLTKLQLSASLSRQDDVEAIERLQAGLARSRQFDNRWFWVATLSGERNSQLSLDYRVSIVPGFGRILVQSNKLDLNAWVGPAFSREQFTGEDPDSSIPLVLAADASYFTWGSLDTTIYGQLQVSPILDQWGRWRISFTLNADREIVQNFDINIGLTESYDSDPTSADAEKNDFSITTALGWNF